jgi:hypothetical protein
MNLYVKLRKVYFGTHPCHAPIILILNAEVSFAPSIGSCLKLQHVALIITTASIHDLHNMLLYTSCIHISGGCQSVHGEVVGLPSASSSARRSAHRSGPHHSSGKDSGQNGYRKLQTNRLAWPTWLVKASCAALRCVDDRGGPAQREATCPTRGNVFKTNAISTYLAAKRCPYNAFVRSKV